MRTDSLLDSVASGILTGGGLRGLMGTLPYFAISWSLE